MPLLITNQKEIVEMNQVNSTNFVQTQHDLSSLKGPLKVIGASVFLGYTNIALTIPQNVRAKTGLSHLAIRQTFKNASFLGIYPFYKKLFENNTLAAGCSGLTQAFLIYAFRGFDYSLVNLKDMGVKRKARKALLISYQQFPANPSKLVTLVLEKSLYFTTLFATAPFFVSFLHQDEESGLSSIGKNAAAGGLGGFIGYNIARQAFNIPGFYRFGIPFTLKNSLRIGFPQVGLFSILQGAAIYTLANMLEES